MFPNNQPLCICFARFQTTRIPSFGVPQCCCHSCRFCSCGYNAQRVSVLLAHRWFVAWDLGCQLSQGAWPSNPADVIKDCNDPVLLKIMLEAAAKSVVVVPDEGEEEAAALDPTPL